MHAFHLSVTAVEMAVPFATCPQPLPSHIIQQTCSNSNLLRNLILVATAEQHHPELFQVAGVGEYQLGTLEQQLYSHSRRLQKVPKRPRCGLLLRKPVHSIDTNRSQELIGALPDRKRWAL